MANDMNTCNFTGRLGRDPETRNTPGGMTVCNFSIAVNGSRKVNDQWEDETHWADCVVFGKSGEAAAQYLKKGSRVAVTARFTVDKWQDQEGNNRSRAKFICDRWVNMDPKPADQPGTSAQEYRAQRDGSAAPAQADSFDDDIPF